jgi:hypothetical protein
MTKIIGILHKDKRKFMTARRIDLTKRTFCELLYRRNQEKHFSFTILFAGKLVHI